jgi:D-alanine-D-alanine ligase
MLLETVRKKNSEVEIYPAEDPEATKVLLLYGGMSAEREISRASSVNVLEALRRMGYNVVYVDMGEDLAEVIKQHSPSVVFNCLHGTYGEDGNVQGLLNILGVPYTNSGVLASALSFDKDSSHLMAKKCGLICPERAIITSDDDLEIEPIERPYIIKPLAQGSSLGIVLVDNDKNFSLKDYDFRYGKRVLLEEFICGRELQVAVLNGEALGVLEIELRESRFFDYEAKYSEGYTRHIMPAPISPELEKQVKHQSEKIYNAIGCNGIARVEFILNYEDNNINFLEINSAPGITNLSLCPEIAAYKGIDFDQFIYEILKTAKYE